MSDLREIDMPPTCVEEQPSVLTTESRGLSDRFRETVIELDLLRQGLASKDQADHLKYIATKGITAAVIGGISNADYALDIAAVEFAQSNYGGSPLVPTLAGTVALTSFGYLTTKLSDKLSDKIEDPKPEGLLGRLTSNKHAKIASTMATLWRGPSSGIALENIREGKKASRFKRLGHSAMYAVAVNTWTLIPADKVVDDVEKIIHNPGSVAAATLIAAGSFLNWASKKYRSPENEKI